MPTHVNLPPLSRSAAAAKASVFVIPRRADVIGTLRDGQRLSVQVLEKFGSGKVMLDIRGAAVTAQAKGDFPVGAQLEVVVEQNDAGFTLRRVGGGEAEIEATLLRFVRAKLGGLAGRNQAVAGFLTGDALASLGATKGGLPGLYARLGTMLLPLLTIDDSLAGSLQKLGGMLGLSPAGAAERLREWLGFNLPGTLDKMLAAGKQDLGELLMRSGRLTVTTAENLVQLAGSLKEQIGLFRGLNALLSNRGQPLLLELPFVYQGQAHPAEIWVYRRHNAVADVDDPETTSAVVRLTMSRLGEVRAHVVLRGANVNVGVFAETERATNVLAEGLTALEEGLRNVGLNPALSVRQGLDLQPVPRVEELVYAVGETRVLDVKA